MENNNDKRPVKEYTFEGKEVIITIKTNSYDSAIGILKNTVKRPYDFIKPRYEYKQ